MKREFSINIRALCVLLALVMMLVVVLSACNVDPNGTSDTLTSEGESGGTTAPNGSDTDSQGSDTSSSDTTSVISDTTSSSNEVTEVTTPETTTPVLNTAYSSYNKGLPNKDSYLTVTQGASVQSDMVAMFPNFPKTKQRYFISEDGGATYPATGTTKLLELSAPLYVVVSAEAQDDGTLSVKLYPIDAVVEYEWTGYSEKQDTTFDVKFKANVGGRLEARIVRADGEPMRHFDSSKTKFYGVSTYTNEVNSGTFTFRYIMEPGEYFIQLSLKGYGKVFGAAAPIDIVVSSVPLTVTADPDFKKDTSFMCYVISEDNSASREHIDFIYAHFWKVYPIMYYAYCDGYKNNTPKVMYINIADFHTPEERATWISLGRPSKDPSGALDDDGKVKDYPNIIYSPASMSGNLVNFAYRFSSPDSQTFNADCMTHELGHAIQSWGDFPMTEPLADYLRSVYGMHYDKYNSSHENWGGDNGSNNKTGNNAGEKPQRNFYIWLCYTYNSSWGGNIVQDIFRRIKDKTRSDYIPTGGWNYSMLGKYTDGKTFDQLWDEFKVSPIYRFNFRSYPTGQNDFSLLDWSNPTGTWMQYMAPNHINLPASK